MVNTCWKPGGVAANETAEGREPDRTLTVPADGSEKRAYMDRVRGFLETTELPPAPTRDDVYAAIVTLAEARKFAYDAMVAAEEAQAALGVARDAEAEAERNLRAMTRIIERYL